MKNRQLGITAAMILALVLGIVAYPLAGGGGQTYYVDATKGNDSNPGTEDQPWLTVQKAADVAQAGDTVYIREGIYNEKVTIQNSGSADNYITFASYPGETATIDGNGLEVGTNWGVFNVWGKSHIKISGLKVINSVDFGIKADYSTNVVIEGNYTRDTYASGIAGWYTTGIVIDGNTVVNARCVSQEEGGHEEGISLGSATNFQISNNEVYYEGIEGYFGGIGICVKEPGGNGTIYGNYAHDIVNDAGIHMDGWQGTLSDVEVYNNRVDNCVNGIVVGEGVGALRNVKIYNNVLSRLGWCGITIHARIGEQLRENISILNNTIYESTGSNGAGIYIQSTNVKDILIRNNIVAFGPKYVGQIRATSMENVTADHNLIYGSVSFPDEEVPGSIEADPEFLNALENVFHLSSSSPAIDSGSSVEAPSRDFDGTLRPQGTGYDIGAYEHAGTASTATPAPTGTPTQTPLPTLTPTATNTPLPTYTPTPTPTNTKRWQIEFHGKITITIREID